MKESMNEGRGRIDTRDALVDTPENAVLINYFSDGSTRENVKRMLKFFKNEKARDQFDDDPAKLERMIGTAEQLAGDITDAINQNNDEAAAEKAEQLGALAERIAEFEDALEDTEMDEANKNW